MKLQDFVTAARVDALEQVGLPLVFILWEFPEIGGATLGVPVPLLVLFGRSILDPPYFGKLPYLVFVNQRIAKALK